MTNTTAKIFGTLSALILMLAPVAGVTTQSDQMAPAFHVQNLVDDGAIELDNFRGQVVYVDFWASWCGPCLKSFPFMENLHQQYSGDGLVIVAINMDQDPQDAHKFLTKTPVNFLIGQDMNGAVAEHYGVQAMPSSFVIDRDGLIQNVHYGFKSSDKEKITSLITKLL